MAIRLIRLVLCLFMGEESMKQFFAVVSTRCVLGALVILSLAVAGSAFAQSPTGNPLTDGWTAEGVSSAPGTYIDGAGIYSATIYTTAFTLSPSSTLVTNLNGFNWSAGDTIVGVGGILSASSDLTYSGGADEHGVSHSGATSTRFVIKYGSPAATWTAPGAGALANGGTGSVLLGTFSSDLYPGNGGQPIIPSDAPQIQTGPSSTLTITGNVGMVFGNWTGSGSSSNLVGFESLLDLTLLEAQFPTNNVQLGDKFVLDLQRGTGNFQDSLGTLPSVVPEPSTIILVGTGLLGLLSIRRRKS
jgi:hypothetical protein